MTSEIRDLYGQLIDGMQGTRGQLKTGGDAAGAELQGSPPTQKPLALYSGIVTVGADGTAEISFDIPEFAGTARVMAVAWTATKLGRATTDVTVRDPVVLTATLPRFLLNGDHGTMSFDLDNVEGAPGDYTINVKASGPVKVTRQSRHHRKTRRQAAQLDVAGARCRRRRHRAARCRYQGAERPDAGAALCARRQGGDADPGAPLDPHPGQGREPDADVGHVLRPGAGHRQRLAVGQPLHRARCRDHPEGARSLSLWLLGADHQPRDAAAVCQRSRGRRASGDGYRGRSAHQGCDRPAAGAARLERLVRAVVGRRRRRLARCLCHGLPDPRPRKGICGAGRAVQERARPRPQLGGQRRRAGKGRRPQPRLRPLRAGPQRRRADRRSALSRRHQARTISRPRSPNRNWRRRWRWSATRRRAERVYAAALDSLTPKPVLEFGRVDYGSRAARCRGAGFARQRRQCAAGDADAGGRSGSKWRAG